MAAATVFGLVGNLYADDATPAVPQVAAQTIPVAAHTLAAGVLVANADISEAAISETHVFSTSAHNTDEIIGKRLTHLLKAGEAFNTATLKVANDVERNSEVTVLFKRPGIQLSGSATALEAGNTGKAIRVLNPDSHATLVATISGPGTVTIGETQ